MRRVDADTGTAEQLSVFGDRVLVFAVAMGAVSALVLGAQFVDNTTAIAVTLLLCGVAGVSYGLRRGTQVLRYVLTVVLVALVALHIQLARGMVEVHFGVFVVLAFLLVYQDWTVIVFGAVLFAVHHVLFDRLQAANVGVYCVAAPDFGRIMLHAAYVVVQAGVEVVLAVQMARSTRQGEELTRLVAAVNQADRIALDVNGMAVETPVGKALKATLHRMNAAVSAVHLCSTSVEVASVEIASGNQDLSARTEQTASNLQQAAASIGALTQGIQQSASNAAEASRLANEASVVAVQGGKVVAQVVHTMQGIHESSNKIGEIIGVINGIAFQTNILALNAAVEAARAGVQGRGFAVVASEVRALAGRSADAAKEIKDLIGTSVARVAQGSALVDQAGATMTQVVDAIRRVSDIVGEISSVTKEQAERAAGVSAAVTHMDEATQQNAAMVEQMAAAADSLKGQARELVRVMSAFKEQGLSSAIPHVRPALQ